MIPYVGPAAEDEALTFELGIVRESHQGHRPEAMYSEYIDHCSKVLREGNC